MNRHIKLMLMVFLTIFSALVLCAQDTAPVDAQPEQGGLSAASLVQWLTPILVPLLLTGVKKLLPKLPSFLIPLLAPIVGVLIGLLDQVALGNTGNIWISAALGLAGVGLREIKDQALPSPNGGWPETK